MRYGFLKGVKNLEKCEAALAEVEKDKTYQAIFGLNEYLRIHENGNDFHRKSSGLKSASIGDEDNLVLQFADAQVNWNQILEKIQATDLLTWTGLSRIDVE